MHVAPPPSPRDLLPPLLACLPTAFISPRPPPALLPLLSPVLRQRVSFLSGSTPASNDGWLELLSWDAQISSRLPAAVERMHLEPHPVSGEIELDDIRPAKYRRLDDETLHARLEVEQFDLVPTYVWCENDEHGGTGPGWKLADLRTMEDTDDGSPWFDTPSEANDATRMRSAAPAPIGGAGMQRPTFDVPAHDEEDDNDDYWASYDRTPGRTPAEKASPAPRSLATFQNGDAKQSQLEHNYFARYGSEVQPALDSHDPDEEHAELAGQSSLTGDALGTQHTRPVVLPGDPNLSSASSNGLQPPPQAQAQAPSSDPVARGGGPLSMPRPISPASSRASSVERLEQEAVAMSAGGHGGSQQALLGVKQHISTDIKSLFRLARSAGMERREFERVVRTELDVLGMLERDE